MDDQVFHQSTLHQSTIQLVHAVAIANRASMHLPTSVLVMMPNHCVAKALYDDFL